MTPSNFVKTFDAGKTRMIGLPYGEKTMTNVKPFSYNTGVSQTDGQTDRETELLSVPLLYHSMGQIIKSVVACLCMYVCMYVCVCGHAYGRIFQPIFTKFDKDLWGPKRKN